MSHANKAFAEAKNDVLAGRELAGAALQRFTELVAGAGGPEVTALMQAACDVRQSRLGRKVSLCAIVNAKSGRCPENCAFCAQSGHFDTGAPQYSFLKLESITKAAKAAKGLGARRLGVVISGKGPDREDLTSLAQALRAVSAAGLAADTSCGMLDRDELKYLKRAGLKAYHHNLETARSFFPNICTTHAYDEDVRAVRAGLAEGLYICSGGVFGLGESWEQRVELGLTLRELGVQSVPINFLHPLPGTPLAGRTPLDSQEALKIIALLRFILPDKQLRICGGRQIVFGPAKPLHPLEAGASGLMIGDYLTTSGLDADSDMASLARDGWVPGGD